MSIYKSDRYLYIVIMIFAVSTSSNIDFSTHLINSFILILGAPVCNLFFVRLKVMRTTCAKAISDITVGYIIQGSALIIQCSSAVESLISVVP